VAAGEMKYLMSAAKIETENEGIKKISMQKTWRKMKGLVKNLASQPTLNRRNEAVDG
jgi:hypothetical protein